MFRYVITLSEESHISYQILLSLSQMNNNILPIVFLMAGMLLAATAVTTVVPAAYAGGDDHDDDNGDGNKNKAEDGSLAQLNDCDNNENSGDTSFFICQNIVD
jgi:hypothetical protein